MLKRLGPPAARSCSHHRQYGIRHATDGESKVGDAAIHFQLVNANALFHRSAGLRRATPDSATAKATSQVTTAPQPHHAKAINARTVRAMAAEALAYDAQQWAQGKPL